MARKRGGVAGFWDNNKGWLKNVVPTALGMIPGVGVPLAVASSAAMRGLDRPGKRGIGFDVKEGAIGAAQGYGMGKLGQGARAGIQSMFAPKTAVPDISKVFDINLVNADIARGMGGGAPTSASSALPSIAAPNKIDAINTLRDTTQRVGFDPGRVQSQMTAPDIGSLSRAASGGGGEGGGGGGGSMLGAVGRGATKALDFATKYEKPLSMLVEGVASGVPSAEVEAARARNALDERKFEEELRQQRLLEQRQALIAELLMPILQQNLARRSASGALNTSMG